MAALRQPFWKRPLDVLVSFTGLILAAPILVVVAVGTRLTAGSPVLFRQTRPGFQGKPFPMYKFRTMTDGKDANGNLLPDSERLTRFGQFLRKTSLDELPELWNVLKGDMSLVGPRPLLMEYLPLYNATQNRRHEVKPGITGWAQVNGRNAIQWDQKFQLDVWYVDNLSLFLDIKIVLKTFWQVLKRADISHENSATMHKFQGNQE